MRVVGVAGRRRLGGIPPIVTVLITISAVVAASLVAWFMFVSTKTATQTPIVEVTNAVYIGGTGSGAWRISFTIRNISGARGATASLSGAQLFCDGFSGWTSVTLSCSPGTTLSPGQSASCSIISVPQPISPSSDGRLGCQLQLSDGTVVGFTATRP